MKLHKNGNFGMMMRVWEGNHQLIDNDHKIESLTVYLLNEYSFHVIGEDVLGPEK